VATHRRSRPRGAGRAVVLPLLLATIALLGVLPSASAAGTRAAGPGVPDRAATSAPDSGGSVGSIQYQESVAHEHDRLPLEAGGRVDVGFSPRRADRWSVAGSAPARLPAGRLDGAAIRGQRTGDRALADPTRVPDRTVDLPTADAVPAEATSWTGPGPSADVSTDASIAPGQLGREVFGFLPYWEVGSSSLRLDQTKLSTIAYFGVGADAAGNLQKTNSDGTPTVGWKGWTSSALTSVINTAHLNHTRVVLTIQSFGWNSTGAARQAALLGSSTARANLAAQIAAAVRDRGVDGVNLDIEPLPSGSETGFTALVRLIRAKLNQVHSGYQLTFDTLGSIGNYPIEAATATGGADAIMIMGYDYRTATSSPVGSVAPLHKNGYDIADTVAAYRARVPASKLILGVPYYGRAWSTATNTLNATNISGTKYGASTTVTYDTAVDFLAANGHFYDPLENVAWTAYRRENCTATYGCQNPWRELYVDDATALGRKFDLVNAYDLRGAGIWALGYDGTRSDFWNVIRAKFIVHTVRYAGSDRYATAAMISAKTFAPGTAVAYIANGGGFADALAGAAAAGTVRGPVLLATVNSLSVATATELKRLKPAKIIVLGGTSVIGSSVERQLNAYATG
jgi:spore germination protein YaaH